MVDLRLAKLPDRTPVKLSVTVTPELHQALSDYATLYFETYGRKEPIGELVLAMLSSFLEGDRHFRRWCQEKASRGSLPPGSSRD